MLHSPAKLLVPAGGGGEPGLIAQGLDGSGGQQTITILLLPLDDDLRFPRSARASYRSYL
jgi:hypothetical protein